MRRKKWRFRFEKLRIYLHIKDGKYCTSICSLRSLLLSSSRKLNSSVANRITNSLEFYPHFYNTPSLHTLPFYANRMAGSLPFKIKGPLSAISLQRQNVKHRKSITLCSCVCVPSDTVSASLILIMKFLEPAAGVELKIFQKKPRL